MEKTGGVEKLKDRITPEMTRATYRVSRHGMAGTAANFALHVAERARLC
jgi:hypothetical protein